jgi:hypothetical protein
MRPGFLTRAANVAGSGCRATGFSAQRLRHDADVRQLPVLPLLSSQVRGVGAGAGTAVAFFTGKKDIHLRAETPLTFKLAGPLTISAKT